MKKSSMVAAGLFGLLSAAVPAGAATTVFTEQVKGDQANATFSLDTPITCDDGSPGNNHVGIVLNAGQYVQRDGKSVIDQNQIDVYAFTRNSCTGESGFGHETLFDPNFHISAQQKATMAGAVFLSDFNSGNPIGFLNFDLKLTGVGTVSRTEFSQHQDFGSVSLFLHSVGAFRSVAASGTITLDGVEMVGGLQDGNLGKTRAGSVTMTKP